jgi:hypothetical protein
VPQEEEEGEEGPLLGLGHPPGPPYHSDESANKAEVGKVVRIDGGGRIDLQAVIVLASVFK